MRTLFVSSPHLDEMERVLALCRCDCGRHYLLARLRLDAIAPPGFTTDAFEPADELPQPATKAIATVEMTSKREGASSTLPVSTRPASSAAHQATGLGQGAVRNTEISPPLRSWMDRELREVIPASGTRAGGLDLDIACHAPTLKRRQNARVSPGPRPNDTPTYRAQDQFAGGGALDAQIADTVSMLEP